MLHRRPGLVLLPCLVTLIMACGDDGPSDAAPSDAAREGREIARRAGCTACHGADGEGGIGPAWRGSLGSEVELADGTTATVDEAYLSRAIADPAAQVRAGFDFPMPINQLTDEEIADIVAYIVELASEDSG